MVRGSESPAKPEPAQASQSPQEREAKTSMQSTGSAHLLSPQAGQAR